MPSSTRPRAAPSIYRRAPTDTAAGARRGRRRRRHPAGGTRARVRGLLHRPRRRPDVQVKGTGIGLSVVLEFVNAHGGTIADRRRRVSRVRTSASACRSAPAPATDPAPAQGAGPCGLGRLRRRLAPLALLAAARGGCGGMPMQRAPAAGARRWTRRVDRRDGDRRLPRRCCSGWSRGTPAEQAEILASAKQRLRRRAHAQPRAALCPGARHARPPGHRPCRCAQRLLREVLANPETAAAGGARSRVPASCSRSNDQLTLEAEVPQAAERARRAATTSASRNCQQAPADRERRKRPPAQGARGRAAPSWTPSPTSSARSTSANPAPTGRKP